MIGKLKKLPLKLHWYFILPITLIILAIYAFVNFSLSNRIEVLQSELQKNTTQAISIHEKLGYGGLIHNFKNYLLRGDEQYFAATTNDAKAALEEVEKLEKSSSAQGLDIHLPQTRLMIETYLSRLEIIEAQIREGKDLKDIDEAVKYDDSEALSEINSALTLIRQDIESQLSTLRRISLFQSTITAILALGFVFVGFWLSRLALHRLQLQSANNDLSETLDKTEKANEALSQFAGVASHDLRSPIRHIRLFADMIEEDIERPEEILEHIKSIRSSTERMNALVKSLLSFAKTSNKEPHLQSVNMNVLIDDILKDMAPVISESQAEIQVEKLPTLKVDRDLMGQVFANLLDNAIKYTKLGESPKIEIKANPTKTQRSDAESNNPKWQFSFMDYGIGIDPEYRNRVFLPLQRLHSHNSEYQGVGIGLALVKSVIESHKGRIWLDTNYRNGTRFLFTL